MKPASVRFFGGGPQAARCLRIEVEQFAEQAPLGACVSNRHVEFTVLASVAGTEQSGDFQFDEPSR